MESDLYGITDDDPLGWELPAVRPSLELARGVAEAVGVPLEEITGPRRSQRVAAARQLVWYVLRAVTGLSYPELGRLIGARDHATVMFGCEQVRRRRAEAPQFARLVERLIVQAGGPPARE